MSSHFDKEFLLTQLFRKFIDQSYSNKRDLPGGRKLSKESVVNYEFTLKLLLEFEIESNTSVAVKQISGKNSRAFKREKKRWSKFYKDFTDYLYDDKDLFDNYVGLHIKHLRTFFTWLQETEGLLLGNFHKRFYVWKEDIQIVVMHPSQLDYLINNQAFDQSLPPHLRRTKDFFVFGCTVALRFSDLIALKKTNLEVVEGNTYLKTISRKTQTPTRIKLPSYAVRILDRNKSRSQYLFPQHTLQYLNREIKKVMKLAGYDHCTYSNQFGLTQAKVKL